MSSLYDDLKREATPTPWDYLPFKFSLHDNEFNGGRIYPPDDELITALVNAGDNMKREWEANERHLLTNGWCQVCGWGVMADWKTETRKHEDMDCAHEALRPLFGERSEG